MKPAAENQFQSLDPLLNFEGQAGDLEARLGLLEELLAQSPGLALEACRRLFLNACSLRRALVQAGEKNRHAAEILTQLSGDPWPVATFLGLVDTAKGRRARVRSAGVRGLVGVHPEVDPGALQVGDEVFLGREQNVIMARSPFGGARFGHTARFSRLLPDGRVILRFRDEESILEPAASLSVHELRLDDQVRCDFEVGLAFERLPATETHRYFIDAVPNLPTSAVGGQGTGLEALLAAMTTVVARPELAARYGLTGRNTIFMHGPPGCGKTLMAKVAAHQVTQMTGRTCRFAVVRPAEWESPWVGETQANIRAFFQALRQAARDGFAVAFLDELEAVGRIRGAGAGNQHADKFLAALLAEINGFEDRANVAIICASNRKDLIDPALLERVSDFDIPVGRPDMRGARAILEIHLSADVSYSPNGPLADHTRQEIIQTAVSRLYAPNADNAICKLRFRDGKERVVSARELVSGRLLEQLARAARYAAFLRDARGDGAPGVSLADMQQAVADALQRLRSTLTIHNAHAYLADLPTEVDVIAVDPIGTRLPASHRYLNHHGH
jgi:proteasome-associated ATPase